MTSVTLGAGLGLILFLLYTEKAREQWGIDIPIWLGHPIWRPIWVFIVAWIGLIGQTLYDRRHRPEYIYQPGEKEKPEAPQAGYQRPGLYECIIVLIAIVVVWIGW